MVRPGRPPLCAGPVRGRAMAVATGTAFAAEPLRRIRPAATAPADRRKRRRPALARPAGPVDHPPRLDLRLADRADRRQRTDAAGDGLGRRRLRACLRAAAGLRARVPRLLQRRRVRRRHTARRRRPHRTVRVLPGAVHSRLRRARQRRRLRARAIPRQAAQSVDLEPGLPDRSAWLRRRLEHGSGGGAGRGC